MSHNYTYDESAKRLLDGVKLEEIEISYLLLESDLVYEEIVDIDRWHITMYSVVRIKDILFGISWYRGSTEYQENDYPYQPERVETYTETVTKYRPI